MAAEAEARRKAESTRRRRKSSGEGDDLGVPEKDDLEVVPLGDLSADPDVMTIDTLEAMRQRLVDSLSVWRDKEPDGGSADGERVGLRIASSFFTSCLMHIFNSIKEPPPSSSSSSLSSSASLLSSSSSSSSSLSSSLSSSQLHKFVT